MPQGPPTPSGFISVPDYIREEAVKAGIPPEFALAVAEQESDFNPGAINPKSSATGVFQFLPSTAKTRGFDPTDPVANIQHGVRYLRELLDKHQGNADLALREFGGVKTDETYVPGVLNRIGKFAQSGPPPPPTELPRAFGSREMVGPPPGPFGRAAVGKSIGDLAVGIASGFDPRTRGGRRNLAGAAGAAAAGLATGGVGFVPALTMMGAAGAAGAAEDIGEQVVAGARNPLTDIELSSVAMAGAEQAGLEAASRPIPWFGQAIGRRLVAPSVSTHAAKALETQRATMEAQLKSAFEAAERGITTAKTAAEASEEAVRGRLSMTAPAVSAAQAGRMTEQAVQGPAKRVLDELGAHVQEAARTGPELSTAPLKARLAELGEQITPLPSHGEMPELIVGGKRLSGQEVETLAKMRPELGIQRLPPDHPLPATLSAIRNALTDADTISFEDAHKMKRLLDEAVNWQSPAKKQAQQITKAFRQDLSDLMSSHGPYQQATAAYAEAVQPFRKGLAPKLHRVALEDPESLVRGLKGDQPTRLRLLRDLLTEQAPKGGGTVEGPAAWNAVRAAWTHKNLVQGGADKLLDRIGKLDPDFMATMYGDTEGQTILKNLQHIGQAFKDVQVRGQEEIAAAKALKVSAKEAATAGAAPTGPELRFGASSIKKPLSLEQTIADAIRFAALGPTSIWGGLSGVRLGIHGPKASDLIEWMAMSPARTQLFVKAVTSPLPALALANAMRATGFVNKDIFTPVPSHDQGPPRPTALSR